MKFNRLFLLLAALATATNVRADLASLFTNIESNARMVKPRLPSIIFIQCHDLAPGDLSCYGQTNYQTPNLDRLATEGLRFTHYTGGVDMPATTAQLLAGKISAPAPGEPSIAQRLKNAGYHTGLIGEWSLPGQPWLQGFDEFAGFLEDSEAQNYYPDALWRYPHVIYGDDLKVQRIQAEHEMIYPNTGGQHGQFLPDLFNKAMMNFVKNNDPDRANHFQPYFLLVNLPAPRTATTGADDFPVPSDAPFTGEAWPQAAKNRAALITRLDDNLGRLREQLGKSKMSNSVAIFFAGSCTPEKFANTNLNFLLPTNQLRDVKKPAPQILPLIVNWPGFVPAGRVSKLAVGPADFAPTALDMAWAKPAPGLTGISLLPVLENRKQTNTVDMPDNLPPTTPNGLLPQSKQF